MSSTQAILTTVTRISGSSVFMVPAEGHTLDFKTVNSAPPTHRSLLQKNGLIAKVCVAVAPVGNAREEQKELYSVEGRLKLWRYVLIRAGLITANNVIVPAHLSHLEWPLLNEAEFNERMRFIKARKEFSEVNESSFCAPVLSVEEYIYKERAYTISVGVTWMPRYRSDAISWCEMQLNGGKYVSEQHLRMLVQHVTMALTTLHKMLVPPVQLANRGNCSVVVESAGSLQRMGCPLTFELEDILVDENDSETVFVVAASQLYSKSKLAAVDGIDLSTTKDLSAYPYLAPEQIIDVEIPVRAPTYDMWALGMILYNLASGTPSATSQIKRFNRRRGEIPLNHPAVTPVDIIKRLRRDLEPGAYSSCLISLVALLLSTDHQTRPTIGTVDAMMQDLNRGTSIVRFPFALGSFDLLRLPTPENLQVNVGARKYVSSDLCCLCKKERNLTKCGSRDHPVHTPAVTSPMWSSDELLPGLITNEESNMVYLYPLVPSIDEKHKRRLIAHALSVGPGIESANASGITNEIGGIDCGCLFQLFGGFAVLDATKTPEGKNKTTVREVLVPYPTNALRRNEVSLSAGQIHFSAALPWPSSCTHQLQKKGRITNQVPFSLVGSNRAVKWFAWVLPKEVLKLENGHDWVASEDGAFVCWFNETLEPSDQDRYFPLTSVRALTVQAKVPRSTLPDNVFRHHIEREHNGVTSLCHGPLSNSTTNASRLAMEEMLSQARGLTPTNSAARAANAMRRRNSVIPIALDVPASTGIVEGAASTRLKDTCTSSNELRRSGNTGPVGSNTNSTVPAASSGLQRLNTEDLVMRQSRPNVGGRMQRPSNSHGVHQVRVSALADVDAADSMHSRRKSAASSLALSAPPGSALTLVSPSKHDPLFEPKNAASYRMNAFRKSSISTDTAPAAISDEVVTLEVNSARTKPQSGADKEAARGTEDHAAPAEKTSANSGVRTQSNSPSSQGMSRETTPGSNKLPEVTPESPVKPLSTLDTNTNKLSRIKKSGVISPDAVSPVAQKASEQDLESRDVSPPCTVTDTVTEDIEPNPMSSMCVVGQWLPADVIEALFQSLTFWIHGTGEHGHLQPPFAINDVISQAVNAPVSATHMAFLSNQLPLFTRNHGHCMNPSLSKKLVLPHHGFVFYDHDENVVGVLALRCSMSAASAKALKNEVRLSLQPLHPLPATSVFSMSFYPSYLPSVGGPNDRPTSEQSTSIPTLQHLSAPLLCKAGECEAAGTSKYGHMLTFSSARQLVGSFTPQTEHLINAEKHQPQQQSILASWIGFDTNSTTLVFADAEQTTWYPFCFFPQ